MSTQNNTPAPQWAVYRKKPVAIQAIQWTGDNLREVIAFTGLHPSAKKWTWEEYETVVREQGLRIFTLEDGPTQQVSHFASVGDWIIRGVKGELYPCKPDIFSATYESTAPTAQPEQQDIRSWEELNDAVNSPGGSGVKGAEAIAEMGRRVGLSSANEQPAATGTPDVGATPRTDQAYVDVMNTENQMCWTDFARQLERELAEARAALHQCYAAT